MFKLYFLKPLFYKSQVQNYEIYNITPTEYLHLSSCKKKNHVILMLINCRTKTLLMTYRCVQN